MSFIKTIVVRAVLERATPTLQGERHAEVSTWFATAVATSFGRDTRLTAGRELRVAGRWRKLTVGNLQARIVNQCVICRG